MAGNKHALTRYRALDACFSNWMRKYYIEDLIDRCDEALAERYPSGDVGISRRTLFDDLNDLDELVAEYGVEISRINDSRRKFYRYNKDTVSLRKERLWIQKFLKDVLHRLSDLLSMWNFPMEIFPKYMMQLLFRTKLQTETI